jgi:hypothetical protein
MKQESFVAVFLFSDKNGEISQNKMKTSHLDVDINLLAF